MSLKEQIDINKLPQHIAIIMDGNGRWAKKKGAMRIFGHQNAVKAVRDATEACAELGVRYLTLYAFSTENWNRPETEVKALMSLLVTTINSEIKVLQQNNIRLQTIGNTKELPKNCQKELEEAIKLTSSNTGMTLILALSYSGRWEITNAVQSIAKDLSEGKIDADAISESLISRYLQTASVPDPELMIRTSGEMRISNFLLWQIAYSELYITEVLWPDFRKEHLWEALVNFQKRERRFGKISEQVN